jgi:hypothetical protein
MTSSEVQRLLLRVLAKPGDSRLGKGRHYLAERVQTAATEGQQASVQEIMAAVWSLLAQGLAYIDYSQPAPENWELRLTEAGAAAAADRHPNPDDPAGYLVRLREIPHMSALVREYATEALQAYNARLYRASAVMLGVASEAAVLEAAEGLAAILNDTEKQQFLEQMASPKLNMVAKFNVFQQKMRSHRDRLPKQVADSLELTVHAVAEFLRVSRNDAGHPTGVKIDREECFSLWQMFIQYARKLYALRT